MEDACRPYRDCSLAHSARAGLQDGVSESASFERVCEEFLAARERPHATSCVASSVLRTVDFLGRSRPPRPAWLKAARGLQGSRAAIWRGS
jgi:hypothetical protein